ncbi:DISARM system helicase DrmA [Methanolobus bombayensis]|uniref:DISARM system helicase DrmA n=1 Tax=Methanolobus bombayensis TaxID=38023 RepID=UPI001AEB898C|nr:hypothetical protein [Methanolobus bombayensis]
MRDIFIEELMKEVLGPRYGPEEVLIGASPYNEYLTGVIIPKNCKKVETSPESEMISSEEACSESEDDNSSDDPISILPTELDPRMKPKSFGISFLIKGQNPVIDVCVTWGRYKDVSISEDSASNDSSIHKADKWKRKPFMKILNINLSSAAEGNETVYDEEDGQIHLNIKKIQSNGTLHVVLSLINDLKIKECTGDAIVQASIYQPSLRVNLGEGCSLKSMENSNEDDILAFIYRENPILSRGHMCSAIWKAIDYQEQFEIEKLWPDGYFFDDCAVFHNCAVRSEFIPLYPNSAPNFTWDESTFDVSPELSALKLSEMWESKDIDAYLSPLVEAYSLWIQKNESSIGKYDEKSAVFVQKLVDKQKLSLIRLKSGIKCLKNNKNALLSFCFANKTIWLQNLWKKRRKYSDDDVDFRWRPFQLAFFLINIESLYSQNSEYRNHLDLLWVPTGGGKTESYLAMMAFVIALRRINAKDNDKNINDITGAGTAVITRYTLRLLTVQQFRRTLLMVTAAEYLRIFNNNGAIGWRPEKCSFSENWLYGSTIFSVGMWVGGSVSPNHLRGDYGAVTALTKGDVDGEPAQVVKCPVCGEWLAIPRSGLPVGTNKLHLIVKSKRTISDLQNATIKLKDPIITVNFSQGGLLPGYYTLSLTVDSTRKIDENEIDELVCEMEKSLDIEVKSFRASRPGYFPIDSEPGRKKEQPIDFEIFCTNPECDLNNGVNHKEGVPFTLLTTEDEQLPDGLFLKKRKTPFLPESRIPIPAYTVDEQIYSRCPTVVVSTADKIARLAFEPRAASLFGNITNYNLFYGYNRKDIFPKDILKSATNNKYCVEIKSFGPPELIVQDELHLMDGPLGSMFGLYESVVDGLIRKAGGKPKYIASSATVNQAEKQVMSLFNRPLFQFPAYGLSFKDSFFVTLPEFSYGWDENRPGRVYMGIYAPGMGPLTPLVRIWSRLLKTGHDNLSKREIINYWTLVGYFNSLRELGGNRALYREDIIERLAHISENVPLRSTDDDKAVELSSRIDSTDIPQILEELENGGQNQNVNENPDAIFTTSMFGTGVDIPHLSLMVVNGQPKTTSQYIQATGRVGREHGALAVTFYKAGRPRDLSHYEIFGGYHHRVNLEVEPASVSPFADGCMAKAAGPAIVSFLRNMSESIVEWSLESGDAIRNSNAVKDFEEFIMCCLDDRLQPEERDKIIEYFKSEFEKWENISKKLGSEGQDLVYNEYRPYQKPEKNVVLSDPAHERIEHLKKVYKNAPQSLREIEETTSFEV